MRIASEYRPNLLNNRRRRYPTGATASSRTPVDRFISVHGGRARGMPAYGRLLPDAAIWKIVAYVEELGRRSGEPGRAAGKAPQATRQGEPPQGGRH
jgi:hypothetical protein